jgi:hypothetical protein
MQIIETRTAKIHLDEHNILYLMMNKNALVDYEDAMDNYLVIKSLTNRKPCLKLIDIRGNVTFSVKAKSFLDTKDVQEKTIARAILINSSVKRVTFNFFTQFNSHEIPTKFFINKKEAIEWLIAINVL